MKYATCMILLLTVFMTNCDSDTGSDPGTEPDAQVTPDQTPDPDNYVPPDPEYQVDLTVTSLPPDATLWVNGQNTGQVTPTTVRVWAGCNDVSLTLAGYNDWKNYVCINQDTELDPVQLTEFVDPLAEYRWLEGDWVRFDEIPIGPRNVTVGVERRADGIYVTGFYPVENGISVEKTDADEFEFYWTEDMPINPEVTGIASAESTEIYLTYKDAYTENTYQYKRP